MQIQDKVVAVTGAARGIGKAIAAAFADKGARIALIDLVPADVEATRAEFAGRGVDVRAYTANVAKEDQVVAALDRVVADFGRLDVMVNNAGIIKDGLLVNLGLRYDFLDPRASRPALEASVVNDTAYVLTVGQSQPASVKQQLSPRRDWLPWAPSGSPAAPSASGMLRYGQRLSFRRLFGRT